jgi:hypothetical protein
MLRQCSERRQTKEEVRSIRLGHNERVSQACDSLRRLACTWFWSLNVIRGNYRHYHPTCFCSFTHSNNSRLMTNAGELEACVSILTSLVRLID